MYIILTYDVGSKRVGMVLRVCRKYLVHVQKSVFEGQISPVRFRRLSRELENIIQPQTDSINVYQLQSARYIYKAHIGKIETNEKIL
ncbi:TPA: CRISPR-associated endonuclease Cas2 [Streptococcus suis]|nr:CRISPR-associated endonuclease Cas2 [Streptococcus suis]